MPFGQLRQGDSEAAQKDIDRIFGNGQLNVSFVSDHAPREDEEVEDN